MVNIKTAKKANMERLKELVEELTVRDEHIFRDHLIFEQIVKLVMDGIWIVDENGDTIYVNDKMALILRNIPAEIISKNVSVYMNEVDTEILFKNINKKKFITGHDYLYKLLRSDETKTAVSISFSPLLNQQKKFRGAILYVKEFVNQDVLNLYKQIFFDLSLDSLIIIDYNGIIKDVNYEFINMIGYDKKDVVGKKFIEFVTTENKAISEFRFNELVSGKDLRDFPEHWIHKDGTELEIIWRVKSAVENELIFASGRRIT